MYTYMRPRETFLLALRTLCSLARKVHTCKFDTSTWCYSWKTIIPGNVRDVPQHVSNISLSFLEMMLLYLPPVVNLPQSAGNIPLAFCCTYLEMLANIIVVLPIPLRSHGQLACIIIVWGEASAM